MWSEFRFAARGLARWRGGLVIAVLTLAVGIGTATSLSSFVKVLLADLPGVPELDRVGRVYAMSRALGVERGPVALQEFDSTLSHATAFAAIGGYAQVAVTLGTGDHERTVTAGFGTPAFFSAMGVSPTSGRLFTAADLTSSQPLVMLSDALWRQLSAEGRLTSASVSVNGIDRGVVGVMPAEFSHQFVGITADLWIPMGPASRETPPIVQVFARLRPGVDWSAANAELGAMKTTAGSWSFQAIPILDDTRQRAAGAYGAVLGTALIVLVMACVNVICMLLARGFAREQELSIRRALGATRARVARLLIAEHALLALVGGVLGCGLAAALLRGIASALAAVEPAMAARIAIDAGLLPIALGASVSACVIFGVFPALRMSGRSTAVTVNRAPATRRTDISGYGRRDVIVFVEIGSAVGLIVFAAMLFNMFGTLQSVRPTFPADRIVTMRVPATDVEAVAARVADIPGVTQVTVSAGMLADRGGPAAVRVQADGGQAVAMSRVPVGAAFFETLGLPLLRGRSFDGSELRGRAPVAVLTESAARALTPSGDPLGMRVSLVGHTRSVAVVIGISRDPIDYGALSRSGLIPPTVFVPYDNGSAQEPVVLARLATDPRGALKAIAAAAETPAGTRRPTPGIVGDEMKFGDGSGRLEARVLGGLALIALLLAATGVFGVVSQSVAQRTREFGIRLAIGATPRGVLGLVLAREMKLIAAALACGALFTVSMTRMAFAELAALSAAVPSVWIAVVGLCGGTAVIAVALAAYRIVRLDPSVVLRRT
jgi:putative ABC transport system permease protein